jgi:hypothetical protein
MTELRLQMKIDAPAERILEVLADSVQVSRWLPQPTATNSQESDSEETMAPRHYHHDLFSTLKERATEWEAGRSYAYVIENFGPIKSAYVSFNATPDADGTLLTQAVNFQMKYGPVGAALDSLIFRPEFRRQMELNLQSLKNYVEASALRSAPEIEPAEIALAA